MPKKSGHSQERRERAVRIVEEVAAELQMSVREVSSELSDLLGVNETTLRGWASRHRSTRSRGRGWRLTSPSAPPPVPETSDDQRGATDDDQRPHDVQRPDGADPVGPDADGQPGPETPRAAVTEVTAARAEVAWTAAADLDQTSK